MKSPKSRPAQGSGSTRSIDASIATLIQEREEINGTLKLLQHLKHHGRLPDPDAGR